MSWLVRPSTSQDLQFHQRASPAKMARLYPGQVFVDASGNGQTTAFAVFKPEDAGGNAVTIGPGRSVVAGQPLKYWKLTGDTVDLMTLAERNAVDAAEKAATIDVLGGQFDITGFFDRTSIKAMGLTLNEVFNGIIDELNAINLAAGTGRPTLPAHTNAKLKARFKVHLGSS